MTDFLLVYTKAVTIHGATLSHHHYIVCLKIDP